MIHLPLAPASAFVLRSDLVARGRCARLVLIFPAVVVGIISQLITVHIIIGKDAENEGRG